MTLVKGEGQRRGKNGLYRLKTHLKTTLKILKGGLYHVFDFPFNARLSIVFVVWKGDAKTLTQVV